MTLTSFILGHRADLCVQASIVFGHAMSTSQCNELTRDNVHTTDEVT